MGNKKKTIFITGATGLLGENCRSEHPTCFLGLGARGTGVIKKEKLGVT